MMTLSSIGHDKDNIRQPWWLIRAAAVVAASARVACQRTRIPEWEANRWITVAVPGMNTQPHQPCLMIMISIKTPTNCLINRNNCNSMSTIRASVTTIKWVFSSSLYSFACKHCFLPFHTGAVCVPQPHEVLRRFRFDGLWFHLDSSCIANDN